MRNERGYSLIELSIVLAALGLVAIVAAKFMVHAPAKLSPQSGSLPEAMFRVDAALKGFLFAQSRLPCPALNTLGVESCGGSNAVGEVPWRTLGLPSIPKNRTGLTLRYGVYRAANATLSLDADLAQSVDRFNPLLPVANTLPPNIVRTAVTPAAQVNAVDACMGLRTAMRNPLGTALRVNTPTGLLQRAYVLVDPGPTDADPNAATVSLFDGLNATATTTNLFEMPETVVSATYNDKVLSVGFSELWGEMHCSASMSAVHAHANIASSAVILQQAESDYRAQLAAINPLSIAGITAATEANAHQGAGGSAWRVYALTAASIITTLNALAPSSALPNGIIPAFTTHTGNTIYATHAPNNTLGVNGWVWRSRNWYWWRSAWHWMAGPAYPATAAWQWSPQPVWVLNITTVNTALAGNYVTQFDTVFPPLGVWTTLTTTVRSNADNSDRAGLFGQ